MYGRKGEDVKVENEEVLLELLNPGQRVLLLPGGRGNASFKSGNNKVLRFLRMEKRVLKYVGIVGATNAGKSTLLNVISAAQPEIANYPFTTLLPNLGVVSFDYDSTMVVADLPVRLELELFSPELAEKPYIVAYNKMDLPEAYENWPSFKEKLQGRGIETFCMSAVKREGTYEVICAAYKLLQETKESDEEFEGFQDPVDLNHVADIVQKQRSSSISEFEITHDSSCNTWQVTGAGLQRFVQMTNWRYIDFEKRFQHVLVACGVNRSLMKLGVEEGDIAIVGEMEMVWHDSAEISSTPNMKKRSTESIKWPNWK
ncbi:hypothetical protein CRYUN_Cryun10bG0019100 [Craigia yunnanensis]